MKNAYELAETILKSRPDKNRELKSSDSFASIELYGTSACKKVQDMEFCECFHLENESGTGMITLYHVFPGIDLVYNDMHMEYCNKEQKPASSVMEINYCMEGRCECVFEQNEYGYTQITGWKRAGVHRFSKEGYGRHRSWIREGSEEEGGNEPDKDGFTKLTKAEQLELPFDLPDREKG